MSGSSDPFVLRPRAQVIGAAVINVAIAIWLIGAPSALDYEDIEAAEWNAVVVGVLVIVIAIVRMLRPATTWALSVLTIALALWLVAASFVLGDWATARVWDNGVVAIVILSEAAVSLVFGRKAARQRDRTSGP